MPPTAAPPMLRLDHIAVIAASLAEGVAYAEAALGVVIPPGGAHPRMGTRNHLLALGPDLFLEVIALDPATPAPAHRRWFAMDEPLPAPRLGTWVVRADDLDAALALLPDGLGRPIPVSRGELSWRIAVPPDGSMPWGGAFPTLMAWPPGPHPALRMASAGCTLRRLRVRHPEAATIERHLAGLLDDARITFEVAPTLRLEAVIATPGGEVVLA